MDFFVEKQKKETKPVPRQTFPILDLEKAKERFKPYIDKIDGILKQAESLKVETDEANQKAVELGTSAKSLAKQIETTRTTNPDYVTAYNFVKGINAFVNIFLDKLIVNQKKTNMDTSIEGLMKQRISTYRAFQEQKRREAELAAKKATEEVQKKLDGEAKKKGIEPVQLPIPIIPKEEPVVRTETGSAHGRKTWVFEIIEPHYVRQLIADLDIQFRKTPLDIPAMTETILKLKALSPYLVISETEVRNAVKGGIREIPSINIFEKEGTIFRTL